MRAQGARPEVALGGTAESTGSAADDNAADSHTREPHDDLTLSYTIFGEVEGESLSTHRDVEWSRLIERFREPRTYISTDSQPFTSFCEYGDIRGPKNTLRHAENVRRCFRVEGEYRGGTVSPETADREAAERQDMRLHLHVGQSQGGSAAVDRHSSLR